jgi:hypothetical protein
MAPASAQTALKVLVIPGAQSTSRSTAPLPLPGSAGPLGARCSGACLQIRSYWRARSDWRVSAGHPSLYVRLHLPGCTRVTVLGCCTPSGRVAEIVALIGRPRAAGRRVRRRGRLARPPRRWFLARNTMSLWRGMTFSCRITRQTELMWLPLLNGYVRQA